MFSLIITIISIALVAALALATLYYGGSAFNRGSAGAEAARLINEGQQLNGAVAIAKADAAAGGSPVSTWDNLVTGGYLSQLPSGLGLTGTAAIQADPQVPAIVTKTLTSSDVCAEVNKRAGHATTAVDSAGEQPGVYGCNTNAGVFTFYYKM
jgi:hypothetical protein